MPRASRWTDSKSAPALAKASMYRTGFSIIRWTSKNLSVTRRRDFTTGTQENYAAYLPRVHRPEPVESDGFVQPYGDSPLDEEIAAENVYLNILNQARDYVYIFTPSLIMKWIRLCAWRRSGAWTCGL